MKLLEVIAWGKLVGVLVWNETKKTSTFEYAESFIRNGIAYVFTRDCLLKQKTILGKKSSALVIHKKTLNVDTLEDLKNTSET